MPNFSMENNRDYNDDDERAIFAPEYFEDLPRQNVWAIGYSPTFIVNEFFGEIDPQVHMNNTKLNATLCAKCLFALTYGIPYSLYGIVFISVFCLKLLQKGNVIQ